jgi:TPR repeat protein
MYEDLKDYKNAHIWYEKAYALGSKDAAFNLARIYRHNLKDYDKALEWYKKAADMGDLGGKKFYLELKEKGHL